jgi:hypothetical protein
LVSWVGGWVGLVRWVGGFGAVGGSFERGGTWQWAALRGAGPRQQASARIRPARARAHASPGPLARAAPMCLQVMAHAVEQIEEAIDQEKKVKHSKLSGGRGVAAGPRPGRRRRRGGGAAAPFGGLWAPASTGGRSLGSGGAGEAATPVDRAAARARGEAARTTQQAAYLQNPKAGARTPLDRGRQEDAPITKPGPKPAATRTQRSWRPPSRSPPRSG